MTKFQPPVGMKHKRVLIVEKDWLSLRMIALAEGKPVQAKLNEIIRAEVLRNKLKEG